MVSNAAVAETWSDILAELGGIPPERVHRQPQPGRATVDHLVEMNQNGGMVDPRERTVAVYTSINEYDILDEQRTLSGGEVLPGLEIRLTDVFGELDRRPPPAG